MMKRLLLKYELRRSVPHLDRRTKRAVASQLGLEPVRYPVARGLELSGAFAVCLVVILVSQMALPGSPLYAIKRASENVRLKVQPSFMYEVVDRRRMELDDLKQQKANNQTINQAKTDLKSSVAAAEQMERESGVTQPNLNVDLNSLNSGSTTTQSTGGGGSNGSGSTPGGSGSTGSGSSTSGSNGSGGGSGGSGSSDGGGSNGSGSTPGGSLDDNLPH